MTLHIREATANDAEAIGRLAKEFANYLKSLGDTTDFKLCAQTYLRDGFGINPAFAGLVAEQDSNVLGYLLYHFGYDTDNAARILHVVDLYVDEKARKHGVGKALMEAVAKVSRDAGGIQLFWSVYVHNKMAASFYEKLGARYTKDLCFMTIRSDAL
jgi:ribosomal protein S18 acetylase RimI-like enzyme